MLAVMVLSQHRVSSLKTDRSRAPYGVRCMGHAVRMWSAFVQRAPHRNSMKELEPFVHRKLESLNTSLQAIKLDPNCLKQAQCNRPWHENMEPGSMFPLIFSCVCVRKNLFVCKLYLFCKIYAHSTRYAKVLQYTGCGTSNPLFVFKNIYIIKNFIRNFY